MAGVRKPARTPEAREQEMIALSMDIIERQMREGTASAQILALFAKSGLGRERLERQRLERENTLLTAKVEQMESASQSNEKLDAVLRALQVYSGQGENVPPDIR